MEHKLRVGDLVIITGSKYEYNKRYVGQLGYYRYKAIDSNDPYVCILLDKKGQIYCTCIKAPETLQILFGNYYEI